MYKRQVAFESKADLHDAEPQQDRADGFDGAEHKVAQIVEMCIRDRDRTIYGTCWSSAEINLSSSCCGYSLIVMHLA